MHLKRLISILESVAIAGRPVSAADLQKMTGIPRPTCYRLLQMLSEQRLLESEDAAARYVIGDRLITIAMLAKTDAEVCGSVAPALKQAAIEFGEAVFLSRLRKNGVKIIHVETPKDPALSYIHPGLGYRPLHACSCSKAIVAFNDEHFRGVLLKGPMKSYTKHTQTDKQALQAELQAIRKHGFAECVEEIEIGVSSIAAPVKMDNVGAVFSIGTIGPIRRFNIRHRKALGKKLIGLAEDIGATIQFAAAV